jgi:hypothetical protein
MVAGGPYRICSCADPVVFCSSERMSSQKPPRTSAPCVQVRSSCFASYIGSQIGDTETLGASSWLGTYLDSISSSVFICLGISIVWAVYGFVVEKDWPKGRRRWELSREVCKDRGLQTIRGAKPAVKQKIRYTESGLRCLSGQNSLESWDTLQCTKPRLKEMCAPRCRREGRWQGRKASALQGLSLPSVRDLPVH